MTEKETIYNLIYKEKMKQKDIAEKFNLTRQRVRQIGLEFARELVIKRKLAKKLERKDKEQILRELKKFKIRKYD